MALWHGGQIVVAGQNVCLARGAAGRGHVAPAQDDLVTGQRLGFRRQGAIVLARVGDAQGPGLQDEQPSALVLGPFNVQGLAVVFLQPHPIGRQLGDLRLVQTGGLALRLGHVLFANAVLGPQPQAQRLHRHLVPQNGGVLAAHGVEVRVGRAVHNADAQAPGRADEDVVAVRPAAPAAAEVPAEVPVGVARVHDAACARVDHGDAQYGHDHVVV